VILTWQVSHDIVCNISICVMVILHVHDGKFSGKSVMNLMQLLFMFQSYVYFTTMSLCLYITVAKLYLLP